MEHGFVLFFMIAPQVGAAMVTGIGSLVGGIFGNNSAKKEAQANRAFQERMARNAHQYEVEDLRKAGLNPVLSALGGSGAATPSGAVANVKDPVAPAISTAMQYKMNAEQIELLDKTTDKTEWEAATAKIGYDNEWQKNEIMIKQPMAQLEKKIQAKQATPLELQVWTDYQIKLRTAADLSANSAIKNQQINLNRPEELFNEQTANSSHWIKMFMNIIRMMNRK